MFFYIPWILLFFQFAISITDSRKINKDFYITGYNESKIKVKDGNPLVYEYDANEMLNLLCHRGRSGPLLKLEWLRNGNKIGGSKLSRGTINLALHINITKHNEGDSLTCRLSEDDSNLSKEKKFEKDLVFMLNYVHRVSNHSLESSGVSEKVIDEKNNDVLEYMRKNKILLSCGLVVVMLVVLVLLFVVCKRKDRKKEDKVNLNASSSNCSVITSDLVSANSTIASKVSRPQNPRLVTNLNEYHEPIDSQAYCEPETYTEPQTLYSLPVPKKLRMEKEKKGRNYVNCKDGMMDEEYCRYEDINEPKDYYSNTYC